MPSFLTRLLERYKEKATRSAAGTAVPAGLDPDERPGPTAHERTLMRRRLRALSRRRQALGGHADELAVLDSETEAITRALEELKTLDELLASGPVARCPGCGELAGRQDPVCSNCGAQLAAAQPTQPLHPVGEPASAPNGHPAAVTGASSARSPSPPAR
jgi:hypothetical protein